jgi:hypothetical protein
VEKGLCKLCDGPSYRQRRGLAWIVSQLAESKRCEKSHRSLIVAIHTDVIA